MGTTIEFYSAQPNDLLRLLQAELTDTQAFEALEALPKADLSLHLRLPDDMDALCRALRAEGLAAPATFRECLVDQVWCDDPDQPSESVSLLSDEFKRIVGHTNDTALEGIVMRWVDALREDPPSLTPRIPLGYVRARGAPQQVDTELLETTRRTVRQALEELRAVSRDALDNGRALLLYLVG